MSDEGLTEAERTILADGTEHTTEAQCWTSSCSGSLPWAVERILADRLAAVQAEHPPMDNVTRALYGTCHEAYESAHLAANTYKARAESAEAERDALRERVEALADDWDAPLGNYQWFAAQVRAALDADRSTDPSAGSERA